MGWGADQLRKVDLRIKRLEGNLEVVGDAHAYNNMDISTLKDEFVSKQLFAHSFVDLKHELAQLSQNFSQAALSTKSSSRDAKEENKSSMSDLIAEDETNSARSWLFGSCSPRLLAAVPDSPERKSQCFRRGHC